MRGWVRYRLRVIVSAVLIIAFLIGAVSLLKLGPAGRPPKQEPQVATYGPCPLAEIDGQLIELGDNCQFIDGELVAVHLTGGWVTAE